MLSNLVCSIRQEIVSEDENGKVIHNVIKIGDTEYEKYQVLKPGVVEVEYGE